MSTKQPRKRQITLEQLTVHDVEEVFGKLRLNLPDLIALIDIDIEQFDKIPSLELKKEFINYRCLQKELDVISANSPSKINQLQLIRKIHDELQASNVILQIHTTLSKNSQALHQWYVRSIAPHKLPNKRHSIHFLEAKDDGVEPGYKGFFNHILLNVLYKKYPDDQVRWQIMQDHLADIDSLYDEYKTEINKFIVKLAHKNINSNFEVSPEKEDLKRTKTVLGLYEKNLLLGEVATIIYQIFKTAPAYEKNIEAVLEAIGNDIARVCRLEVQEQYLYPGFYEQTGTSEQNQVLKLMLMAKWVDNANILKPLAGAPNHQYRVKNVLIPHRRIKYLSNNNIKHFAQHLPLFIVQGDNDAIGSRGQNKIVVDDRLIGIDFGHAYQNNIINKIRYDFSVADENFKNYSVFYDCPRSEIIRGLLIQAKLKGEVISPEVIASYGEDFVEMYNKIQPGDDERVFDDYIAFFISLEKEFPGNNNVAAYNRMCCQKIVAKLIETKEKALHHARDPFVEKFSQYLQLPKQAVDLLQNMEKAMAGANNTTLLERENGEALLHHIRIKQPTITQWQSNINNGHYTFHATFINDDAAKAAQNTLLRYMNTQQELVSVKVNGNCLAINFADKDFNKLSSLFSENRIKQRYHAKHYDLYRHYLLENELNDQLQILKEFGYDAILAAHEDNENYKIILRRNECPFDPLLEKLISEQFKPNKLGDDLQIVIRKNSLSDAIKKFTSIPFAIHRERDIQNRYKQFSEAMAQFTREPSEGNQTEAVAIQRINENSFKFIMPTNWDSLQVEIAQKYLGEFHLENNSFYFQHNEFQEFNNKLKLAWNEYENVYRKIQNQHNEFKMLTQYNDNIDRNMEVNLQNNGDQSTLTINFDSISGLFAQALKNYQFMQNQTFPAKEIGDYLTRFRQAVNEYSKINNRASDYMRDFLPIAENMNDTYQLAVNLREDNGNFVLTVDNDSNDPSFISYLKESMNQFLVNDSYFKFQVDDLGLLNEVFFDAGHRYGEARLKIMHQEVWHQFNQVFTAFQQTELGKDSKITLDYYYNNRFTVVLHADANNASLLSLLPNNIDDRGRYIVEIHQLKDITVSLQTIIDDHIAKQKQIAYDEQLRIEAQQEAERQELAEETNKQENISRLTAEIRQHIKHLLTELKRPVNFGIFASIRSAAKTAASLVTPNEQTAEKVSEKLRLIQDHDKLDTRFDLADLNIILQERKARVDTLADKSGDKYVNELELLTIMMEKISILQELLPPTVHSSLVL